MRRVLMLLMAVILWVGGANALADDVLMAEAQLKERVDQAMEILRRSDLELSIKKEKIVSIVEPLFDFPLMAKLVLGRKHWSRLNAQEQTRFETLFVKRLKSSYIDKIDQYSDETIEWRPSVQDGTDRVQVPSALMHQQKEIIILYKLYRTAGGWKIYDVEVQGISIVTTFRSQFDQILSTGTVADLFHELEKSDAA